MSIQRGIKRVNSTNFESPSPFLRWAGGKRKLAEIIVESFPSDFNPAENRFYEPFLGGGALSFYLGSGSSPTYVPGKNLYINDINPDLVTTYRVVRDDVNSLLEKLSKLAQDVSREEYERIRKWKPTSEVDKATRFIYLNKTCFNGLWRVNSKGEFNVPWGQLKKPMIYDKANLLSVSNRLEKSSITNLSFASALANASDGDLVYLDPPYIPLNPTSSFSKYAKEDFGVLDQYALAGVIDGLTSRGVKVILSNSDTPLTRQIYGDSLTLRQISVNRSISARSLSRTPVNEVIGVNFRVASKSLLKGLRVVS